MALNVRRAGDDDWPRFIKMLLVGPAGAGKTRFSSTAPNVLYLNAEGGMMSVVDRKPAVIDVFSSAELLQAKMALDQDPAVREKLIGFPVSTVVIDTIDEVARLLIRERCDSQKKETMAIADWGWLGDQLRGIVRGFRNLDLNVIMCCHLRSSEDSESGRTLFNPSIQGAMGEEIPNYVDLAVLLRARRRTRIVDGQPVEEMVRYLQCVPDLQHPWIKDRSGKLPAEFDVSLDDDFKRLDALIYGDSAEELRQISADLKAPSTQVAEEKRPAKKRTKVEEAATPEPIKATTVEDPPAPPAPIEPDPTPEPTPEPEPEPEPRPEPPAPTPEPEPAPEPTPTEPTPTDPPASPAPQAEDEKDRLGAPQDGPPWECADCSEKFDNSDQADISYIRARRRLCPKCFREWKLAKKTR